MLLLQHWRKRNGLTQADAATVLGVSQPYLSLLEKGARPLTPALRSRMRLANPEAIQEASDDLLRSQLSALGYPGFFHLKPSRPKPHPDALLLSVLSKPVADARVVNALPWLVLEHAGKMDLNWLVRQAKLHDLQNRLGFVLQLSGAQSPQLASAVRELERARLLQEATLCWDSMPAATRDWMRANRAPLAQHWNILTRLQPEDVSHAA